MWWEGWWVKGLEDAVNANEEDKRSEIKRST